MKKMTGRRIRIGISFPPRPFVFRAGDRLHRAACAVAFSQSGPQLVLRIAGRPVRTGRALAEPHDDDRLDGAYHRHRDAHRLRQRPLPVPLQGNHRLRDRHARRHAPGRRRHRTAHGVRAAGRGRPVLQRVRGHLRLHDHRRDHGAAVRRVAVLHPAGPDELRRRGPDLRERSPDAGCITGPHLLLRSQSPSP